MVFNLVQNIKGDKSFSSATIFPVVQYNILFFSMAIAIFVMLLLPLTFSMTEGLNRTGGVLELIIYYMDPLLIHLCASVCVAILIWYSILGSKAPRFYRLLFSLFVPFAILVLVFCLDRYILKPSFAYTRPAMQQVSPWLVAFLKIDQPTKAGSCPSGFVVRQMFLLMTGFVFYWSAGTKNGRVSRAHTRIEKVTLIILSVSVLFIAFSRVYSGFHTVYDVGISVSVSCYLFWFFYYLFSVFLRIKLDDMDNGIAAATCILVPGFLYYSQDTHWWIFIGVVLFWILGLTHIVHLRRVKVTKTCQR